MGKLTGKTALITGASQGIGEGIARTFARYGANLILLDISEKGWRMNWEDAVIVAQPSLPTYATRHRLPRLSSAQRKKKGALISW